MLSLKSGLICCLCCLLFHLILLFLHKALRILLLTTQRPKRLQPSAHVIRSMESPAKVRDNLYTSTPHIIYQDPDCRSRLIRMHPCTWANLFTAPDAIITVSTICFAFSSPSEYPSIQSRRSFLNYTSFLYSCYKQDLPAKTYCYNFNSNLLCCRSSRS